ncbi:MAG: sigma-70 family RNA polymerase sigma factor [candidate division Zixibacteria bacterium]|nr:sigma-70 family RNA polymerase sigma factor [candidate division Zixibacteria bacterium]
MKTGEFEVSDEKLLMMVKAGDKDAFRHLVERYKKKAYYLALKLVGDPADAMDISQEAFIRVYNARKRYDQDRSFFSWFYTIIANLCKNHLKKLRVRADYKRSTQDEARAGSGERALSPDLLVEADETREQVWEAIEKLSFEHREIIVLRHFEDMSYEEIAESLGIPVGSVMSRLYYARKKMKEELGILYG